MEVWLLLLGFLCWGAGNFGVLGERRPCGAPANGTEPQALAGMVSLSPRAAFFGGFPPLANIDWY